VHRTDLEGDVSLVTDGTNVTVEGTRVADPTALATPGTHVRRGANDAN
jgi:hypothetical protein